MEFVNFVKQFGLEASIVLSISSCMIAFFIAFYDNKKYKWWQGLIQVLCMCVGACVLNTALAWLFMKVINITGGFSYTFFFSIAIVSSIYVVFFTNHAIKPKIMTAMAIYSMYFVLTTLGNTIPTILTNLSPEIGKYTDIILRYASFLLTIPFAYLTRVFNMNKIKHIHRMSVVFVFIYCSIEVALAIMYHSFRTSASEKTWFHGFYISLIFLSLAVINTLSYMSFYNVNRSHSEALELQIKLSELEKAEEMMRMSEDNLEEMRKLRHDTKNQYGLMKLLILDKKYDELVQFFEQYGDGIIEPLSFITCENKNLAAVLNMELSKARSAGIDFDVKIAVPESMSLNTIEQCSLFANLLDNAIEACKRYDIQKPVIGIRIRQLNNMIYISITNPVPKELEMDDLKLNKTAKENKRLHGYGNKIVSQIIKEHNGSIKRTLKDGIFEVDIMME